MSQTCPFCLQADLPDGARKCWHCGSSLDPAQADRDERFRSELRQELKADLAGHRAFIESLLSQLKTVAGVIVVAAAGAAVYFGFSTRENISTTATRIEEAAEKSIAKATDEIVVQARAKVEQAVEATMRAPETARLIDATLTDTVGAPVESAVEARSAAMEVQVAAELAEVTARIEEIKGRTQAAASEVEAIQASFGDARRQTIESSRSVLPVQPVSLEDKGDLYQLQQMVAARVESLGFTFGGYYVGPVVWRYFEALTALPEFRYAVVMNSDGTLFGLYDARALAAALNPPDDAALRVEYGGDPRSLPDEERVPGWTEFARALTEGDPGPLAGLPSFVPAADAIAGDATSLAALDRMEKLGADRLPVVGPDGRFVGIIDRSRLTTRVLLEIAAERG